MTPRPKKKELAGPATLVLLALAAVSRGRAQDATWGIYREDPLWTALIPRLTYIKTDVEAQRSSYQSSGGGNVPPLTWVSVQPAVGIEWNNYVYHPDLLTYSLLFEPGYYWQNAQSGASSYNTDELMLNGHGTVNLLDIKPYATSLFFNRSHQDVQYDFFSPETVDSQGWGATTGYRDGPVPVSVTFEQSEDSRNALIQTFDTSQTKLNLHATNERKNEDRTQLDYQFNQYENATQGSGAQVSSDSNSHHVIVTDSERFKKSTLSTTVFYTEQEWQGNSQSDFNASTYYNLEHTPHLSSVYSYTFNDNFGNGYDAILNSAMAGINHQLYESLASHLDVHGSTLNSSFEGTGPGSTSSSLDSTSFGTAGSLDYNKRLGNWGHLNINNSVNYDYTDQQAGGSETVIPSESYTLPASGPLLIRLRTLGDVAITGITKNNVPLDSSEWQAITGTDPWQVQFFSGGAHSVSNGDVVQITYVVQSNPSGSYSVFTYQGQVGLRFWGDRAGIHGGYNRTMNYTGTPGFVLQDIEELDGGADVSWHGFHAAASYADQRATFSSTRTYSLVEGYSTPLTLHSTVGLSFNQQWNSFSGGTQFGVVQPQDMTFYNYMLHYDWHPVGGLNFNAEAGYQQQRGGYYDEDLFAVRTYLDWFVGKLEFHLGYQHDNQQFTRERNDRDYVFLRMRRNF